MAASGAVFGHCRVPACRIEGLWAGPPAGKLPVSDLSFRSTPIRIVARTRLPPLDCVQTSAISSSELEARDDWRRRIGASEAISRPPAFVF